MASRIARHAPNIFAMFVLSRTFRFEISDDSPRRLLWEGKIEPSSSSTFHHVQISTAIRTSSYDPKLYDKFVLSQICQIGISEDSVCRRLRESKIEPPCSSIWKGIEFLTVKNGIMRITRGNLYAFDESQW